MRVRVFVSLFVFVASLVVARSRVVAADAAPATTTLPAKTRPAPGKDAPAETKAQRELRETMDRERATWERLRANPDDPDAQKRATSEFRDIITSYENVLRASPEYAEAYAAYGLLLSRVADRASATKAFMRANMLNPNLPMVKNQLGNFLTEEGNYKEALAYYLSAIELKSDEPLYHYQLGSLLTEFQKFFVADGLFDRATADAKMQIAFRRAAELAPDNWAYTYRYAESFYDMEKPEWSAALAEWQKLEQKTKTGVETQTIRLQEANVLIKLERRGEARALLETVTEPVLAENKVKLVALLDEAEKK